MRVIVTGATGFIGHHVATCLAHDGHHILATGRSAAIGQRLQRRGIGFHAADIRDAGAVVQSFRPADCVIHCAGKSADWGDPDEFRDVNVTGTRNVARACAHHGIPAIVFLSTPSVYYTGRDRLQVSEDEPLPARPATHYARTKLVAEHDLLSHPDTQVIILRPRAVFGPGDTTITPRILRMATRRRFPLIAGGRALTDITYIDNLVDAIRLSVGAPQAAWQRAYNISNGEPIRIRDWFARVLAVHDQPFTPRSVPAPLAKAVALLTEVASKGPFGPRQPTMTRFSVGYMATSMTLSIEAARSALSYTPRLSNDGGFDRLALHLHTAKESGASQTTAI